ncbi:hypothetical protein [Vibrio intestinalis]|uniref:hypothetical protein n=1 Tax=Vibrio intestinalis TaxID=2933291 RepID=UPI0021A330FB|nr:hypothetical protein [Vibrio intestinalis]
MNIKLLKPLIVALLVLLQVGCVVYPTTRSYYQPIPFENQTKVKSQSCGYHKAAEDGLMSVWRQNEVRIYPNNDVTSPVSFTVVVDGLSNQQQWHEFGFELKDARGKLWQPSSVTLSHIRQEEGALRAWINVEFSLSQQPENATLQNIEFMLQKDEKPIESYRFEFKQVSDIYYSSINC